MKRALASAEESRTHDAMWSGFTRFIGFFLLFLGASMVYSASAEPVLQDIRVEVGSTQERVALTFNSRVEHQDVFTLTGPDRLVIDLPTLKANSAIALSRQYSGNMLKQIRLGQFDKDTTRIVCDLLQPVTLGQIYVVTPNQAGQPWQLVLDVNKSKAGGTPSDATAPQEAAGVWQQGGTVPAPQEKPIALAHELKKPMIVIDAGHGGKDPGTVGRGGLYEREITWAYAQALQKELLRSGRYRVSLTRQREEFVTLLDRVKRARAVKGDLFISLHADSNPNQSARGLSVYTVSEKASDAESAALAQRENKADILAGFGFGQEDEDVANILIDLATRATKNRSSRFANAVVEHMDPKVTLLPNTHRFAGFRVLKAPDIPSVLIELGFLSNRQDEKLLQSREYQARVVQGIHKAIESYFAESDTEYWH